MTKTFYQEAREIAGEIDYQMLRTFFCRAEIPRFVAHRNLVLLFKKVTINNFADLRPIYLSNFIMRFSQELFMRE